MGVFLKNYYINNKELIIFSMKRNKSKMRSGIVSVVLKLDKKISLVIGPFLRAMIYLNFLEKGAFLSYHNLKFDEIKATACILIDKRSDEMTKIKHSFGRNYKLFIMNEFKHKRVRFLF